jgi:hypothetical protein
MNVDMLSNGARNLFRRRVAGEDVQVTPDNLKSYRELARAGVMEPFSGFMRGPEAVFRFTEDGWKMRQELQRSRFTPSAMLRRIRRAFSPPETLSGPPISGLGMPSSRLRVCTYAPPRETPPA